MVSFAAILCAMFGPKLYARYQRWARQRAIVTALEQVDYLPGTLPPDDILSMPSPADWVELEARRAAWKAFQETAPPDTQADRP